MVVIDNIIITVETLELHITRLKEMLRRLNDAGLRLKFEKCKFLQHKVIYLRYKLNRFRVQPIKKKGKKCARNTKIENILQLRSFLGSINYYATFISNIATMLRPLYKYLENKGFNWTKNVNAFRNIKEELTLEKF